MKHLFLVSIFIACPFLVTVGQELSPSAVCSGSHDYQDENMSWYGTVGGVFTETLSNANWMLTQGFQQGLYTSLGIRQQSANAAWVVFPNPVNQWLVIQHSAEKNKGTWSLKIYNNRGAVKLIREMNGPEVKIDVSALSEGLYLIWATFEGQVPVMLKFIKI